MDFAEIARLIENLLRIGVVTAVRHGTPPRVRVQTGGITTDWLPWMELRAGGTRTWSPPTEGEQVLLLSVSGDLRNAVILTGIPSDQHDVPSHSAVETVTEYPDGARTVYDHAAGALSVSGVKTVVVEAATSVLVKCPDTTFDGNVTVKGLLAYQNGIAGQGGENGNVIRGDLTHQGGNLSSNGVVVHDHGHGGVQRGGSWTDGTR
ncbi:phage baseplate assembly protein V [Cupriavidus pinatubonensis]|uniref:phage baseplate assembly protein V n=1 Tax=Cupriavidus pinatubonensis TaxID=248026 RepID=UPI00112DC2AD|nr:phage baseplate assembly protein V [Cupriavidus pinatubonensis]TPQ33418.1 phage baseplate assembly protein V [Cupriavidus pinatubonensis]